MFLKSLRLQNLLSFGPDSDAIPLGPLNVIIGPNGSGKSNLIAAIGLLASTPSSLSEAIREGGGVSEWLWKGSKEKKVAHIEAVVLDVDGLSSLRYQLAFTQNYHRFELIDERLEEATFKPENEPTLYYGYVDGLPHIRTIRGEFRSISKKDFKSTESILSQRRDSDSDRKSVV